MLRTHFDIPILFQDNFSRKPKLRIRFSQKNGGSSEKSVLHIIDRFLGEESSTIDLCLVTRHVRLVARVEVEINVDDALFVSAARSTFPPTITHDRWGDTRYAKRSIGFQIREASKFRGVRFGARASQLKIRERAPPSLFLYTFLARFPVVRKHH